MILKLVILLDIGNNVLRIVGIDNDGYAFFETYERYHTDLLEPWIPHNGEWCWFWDDCTPHKLNCRQFGKIIPPGDEYYCASSEMYSDSEQNPYDNCEPFMNSLPLHFRGKI